MLRFLFPRLTPGQKRGEALFAAVSAEARKPHWYAQGHVPDTIDGRFRMLATIGALVLVRLEHAGVPGDAPSVAFTERFVEVMESEHREIGLGDPTLGRTVRKLVSALSRRVDLWRSAVRDNSQWSEAARESVYGGHAPATGLEHTARQLREFWERLSRESIETLAEGPAQ